MSWRFFLFDRSRSICGRIERLFRAGGGGALCEAFFSRADDHDPSDLAALEPDQDKHGRLTFYLCFCYSLLMDTKARTALDRLLKGISTSHVETIREAWRELLQDGSNAVPQVREKLASAAWTEPPRDQHTRYFGVLLALLDELDKAAFKSEVPRLLKSKLHPVHKKTLAVLSKRTSDEPAAHIAEGVAVYGSAEIADHSAVLRSLRRWCKTDGVSLKNVTRIDVILRQPELDYLGAYDLYTSGIILTWPVSASSQPTLWLRRLKTEVTFYHEVGHHIFGHIKAGQHEEQEREANDYARSMMRKSRPVQTFFLRVLCCRLQGNWARSALSPESKHSRVYLASFEPHRCFVRTAVIDSIRTLDGFYADPLGERICHSLKRAL